MFTIPDEVHKGGDMTVQDRVLNVQQPAIKAIVGRNVGQLQRSSLCTLLCPQQQLTKDGASFPLCDECAKYLHAHGDNAYNQHGNAAVVTKVHILSSIGIRAVPLVAMNTHPIL